MKHEIIFWLQFFLFVINICLLIYLMDTTQVKYKWARISFIIIMSIGFFINRGETSWFAILFVLTPFVTLIKLNHANINRISKKHRDYLGRRGEHLQGVEGGGKSVF